MTAEFAGKNFALKYRRKLM